MGEQKNHKAELGNNGHSDTRLGTSKTNRYMSTGGLDVACCQSDGTIVRGANWVAKQQHLYPLGPGSSRIKTDVAAYRHQWRSNCDGGLNHWQCFLLCLGQARNGARPIGLAHAGLP